MDIAVSLIRRCKNKDGEAFNLLLKKHERYLYQICYRFTFDKDEALDIMQEIYIKIFHSFDSYDEKRPFLPWLKRIAVNTCLNYKRDHLKGQGLSLEGSCQEQGMSLLEVLAAEDDPEKTAILHNTQEIIMASMKKLPEQYRMALTLRTSSYRLGSWPASPSFPPSCRSPSTWCRYGMNMWKSKGLLPAASSCPWYYCG